MEDKINFANSYFMIELTAFAHKKGIPLPSGQYYKDRDPMKDLIFLQALSAYCAEESAKTVKINEQILKHTLSEEQYQKLLVLIRIELQQKNHLGMDKFEQIIASYKKESTIHTVEVSKAVLNRLGENILGAQIELNRINSEIQEKNLQVQELSKEIKEMEASVVNDIKQIFAEFKQNNMASNLSILTDESTLLEEINAIAIATDPREQLKSFARLFQHEPIAAQVEADLAEEAKARGEFELTAKPAPKNENKASTMSFLMPSLIKNSQAKILIYHAKVVDYRNSVEVTATEVYLLTNQSIKLSNTLADGFNIHGALDKQVNNNPFNTNFTPASKTQDTAADDIFSSTITPAPRAISVE
jgi:hypothetical protein